MSALADRPAASSLTLRPLPKSERSTIAVAPYLPADRASQPLRRL